MDLPDLRPLSFGELLDRTFTYYRRHFRLFVGIMAIPQALMVAMNLLLQGFQTSSTRTTAGTSVPAPSGTVIAGTLIAVVIFFVGYFVFYAVAQGATTFAVSEVHLGRSISARAAYGMMRGRYRRLFDLIATIAIRMILAFIAIMAGFGLVAALGGAIGSVIGVWVPILAMLVGGLGVIAGAVLVARYFLRYACSIPALLLESLKAGPAIRRSLALTKDNVGRIFVISLLMTLVAWTVAGLLQGPFMVAQFVMALQYHTPPPFWLNCAAVLAAGIGQAITAPLIMIALVLLYYDIRVRKEGFDLQVMMSALDAQSPVVTAAGDYLLPVEPPITEMNVLGLIALNMFTLGLYSPVWFLQKRSAINKLHSNEKLGVWHSIGVLLLVLLVVLVNLGVGYQVPFIRNFETLWAAHFTVVAGLAIAILMVVQAFKVRSILEEHTRIHAPGPLAGSIALLQDSSFSGLATFFLGIIYLQFKMNEMVEAWSQSQPAAGRDFEPVQ